ncbi:MAG TPA: aldo/keto reductase [Aliidongia sp.]|uniref:aldo/keto reductase n=1 Tax=Aliidongia sp. TaxID=1914230 RepID=UPI002DDCCC2A|nr:aldo/keto reductase [Aliidongia sp.]HEV2674519.1 aldo/keto reductase [Aliidongia sp.]
MRYNQLGRTGLFVSELCLGTMTFGGSEGHWAAIGQLDQDAADKLVHRTLEAGINFIDTADVYSQGRSEEILGTALQNLEVKRSDVVIATKLLGAMGKKPNDRGASRGHIMDAVEASLERLQTDHIDLYQVHGTDPVTPIDETLRALDDLVASGLVRYIGVSNWAAWRIMKALGLSDKQDWARFETVQAYYTIAGRDLERELVPMMRDQQMGLLVWSPLAGGLLSGKYGPGTNGGPEGSRRLSFDFPPVNQDRAWACVEVMRGIAERHGVSVARVALAWILAKPHVTSIIIGAKNVEQLDDNIAATTLSLTAEDMKALDEVSALPPEYPAWMEARQGADRRPNPFGDDRA